MRDASSIAASDQARDAAAIAACARRWREHGDREARDELFERFRPLASRLATRYTNPSEPLEDLVQVACVGLLAAVDRFDPDRGARFVAYAVPTIIGELKRHFRNTGWSAHVPRGAQEMALSVDRATRHLTADTGRAPRVDELAQFLEVGIEDVIGGLEAAGAHYAISLDTPAPCEDPADAQPLADRLGGPDDRYGLVETKLTLAAVISRLPAHERRALTLRVEADLTQSEIAERLGCSQMQVSRLLRRAATRVRELTDPELVAAREPASR